MVVQFELKKGQKYNRKSVDGTKMYYFEAGKPITVTNEADIRGFRRDSEFFREVGIDSSAGESSRKPLEYKKFEPGKR